VKPPQNEPPTSSVTYAMLISEAVYRLVVAIERTLRWFSKRVLPPLMLLIWCLRW
jgi:hypothetical protein